MRVYLQLAFLPKIIDRALKLEALVIDIARITSSVSTCLIGKSKLFLYAK